MAIQPGSFECFRPRCWRDRPPIRRISSCRSRNKVRSNACAKTESFFTIGMNDQMIVRSRSEEHTSELQSLTNLVCRLLLEKKKELCCGLHGQSNSRH